MLVGRRITQGFAKWVLLVVLLLIVGMAWQYKDYIRAVSNQSQMFSAPKIEDNLQDAEGQIVARELADGLSLASTAQRPAILSFSKTNGYRHHESIAASVELLDQLAADNHWWVFHTEHGGVFTQVHLAQFDLIILNHKTGTVWTADQRVALREYVETGGTLIALHAAGDASNLEWSWYAQEAIKAKFLDHPMQQHIQRATLVVEDPNHPSTQHLPLRWQRADEWYNFETSPRVETHVLVSIDESTYDPEKSPMGTDHPMVWWHAIGQGRYFYSALGHTRESYQEPEFRAFVSGAIRWGLGG